MSKIAVYMRCSSHHQSFDLQESEIGEYLEKERALSLKDTIVFTDKKSGKSSNRPGLQRLKKEVSLKIMDHIREHQSSKVQTKEDAFRLARFESE